MKATERFLNYIKIHTASDPESKTSPSTSIQFDLANLLTNEMKTMGISDVIITDTCYVYGTIPAVTGFENSPAIGFIAHMDTSPDFSGENINPQIIKNYNGDDVSLQKGNRVLSVKNFPHLLSLKGRTLITTDGTTLMGADDKAGIAEILTACEKILTENIPHGKICIAFTPDEEIGKGTDHFDIKTFGADFAFTMDGGEEGEINYENFNACEARFSVNGVNVHPGSAKNIMVNASLVAFEINSMLPSGDIPRNTESFEGFYHLCDMEGSVEKAKLHYIVRDHSKELFGAKKSILRHIEKLMNEKYGDETVELKISDQYCNMSEVIKPYYHLIENAQIAMKKVNLNPITIPIRGGTDGARLSFLGLPCPNLCTGGYAYHGPFEHITAEGLENCSNLIVEIVNLYAMHTIQEYKQN
ncbi:MAG: peptidase T [Flexilinea sp.]